MPIPALNKSSELMRQRWNLDRYPQIVYVETTNYCNARCRYCLYERMERPVKTMSLEQFGRLCRKIKQKGLMIGALFCFGEPLADKGLFHKIRYARSLGILKRYMGLNTNCTYLTKDKYLVLLDHTFGEFIYKNRQQ